MVVLAFVIATPVVYWLMHQWLQGFAYRIQIQCWMFALAAILALGVAFCTVSLLAIRAARVNPVKSLRTD
jgi:putative ABC transport system permease protein